MGEGRVIESGTHAELLQHNGAYMRLVEAQKLREGDDVESDEEEDKAQKPVQKEIPLDRKSTNHSLASDILEQKRRQEAVEEEEEDYSVFYMFKRMAPLCRHQWSNYVIGAIFACSAFYSSH